MDHLLFHFIFGESGGKIPEFKAYLKSENKFSLSLFVRLQLKKIQYSNVNKDIF